MNSSKHSKSDIIGSALAYQYATQAFTDFPYAGKVREKVDALFSILGDGIQHVHTDHRRSIHEYNGSDFSVQSFEVHSADVPLGNHFHKKAVGYTESNGTDLGKLSEMFVFDEGQGLLLLQDLDPEGNVIGKIEELSIRARDIIVIPPFQAHTFFLESGTKFRGFRPYPFNKDDMDLNKFELELPK
ncbi:hypothetical protein K2X92_05960 [Candidatus Gracilibacteria bacterium]|nr:hypothetical protein [Candidatus Gracilibacteria bacterium]